MNDEEFARAGGNRSATHVDFMIGSDDVTVTGLSAGGERTPVLARGAWQV